MHSHAGLPVDTAIRAPTNRLEDFAQPGIVADVAVDVRARHREPALRAASSILATSHPAIDSFTLRVSARAARLPRGQ